MVTRPDDIDIGNKEKVYVYEPGVVDWLLGRGQTLQGCQGIGNMGETNLYEALISPADAPGIPSLSSSEKRIWAAIWHSEGALEAINSYDSAFLSFGPMQQTMGKAGKKGELQGALHYVKSQAAQLFEQYFGQYKLVVVELEDSDGLSYGHVKIDGKLLKTAVEKQVLRDFIWAYRCVKAMSDETFREHFLTHGFNRLTTVKGLTHKFDGTNAVKLSDVFKMELSLALLLDVHINLPNAAKELWPKAVKKVLELEANEVPDLDSVTEENEYAMIEEIIALRASSGMWDPVGRAAFIVLCCKDLDDELTQKLGYVDLADVKTKAGLAASSSSYMYGFLRHSR